MVAVLLTILKIIGIVLLAVVALALLLILIVLFVPIRYRIRADKSDNDADLSFRAGVTFLLHFLSGGFVYENGETDRYGKILGIKVWPLKEKDGDDGPSYTVDMNDGDDGIEDTTYNNVSADTQKPVKDDIKTEEPVSDIPSNEDKKEENSITIEDRIAGFFDRIASKYEQYSDKIENIKRDIRFWDKMIHDTRNQDAVSFAKDILVRFLKKIAPRSVKGTVHFGFDDPYTVGTILSYLAMVYPVLPRKLLIDPHFEDSLLYGDIDIKGRLALITVAVAFVRLYFNKDCKRLYRIYKKHRANR